MFKNKYLLVVCMFYALLGCEKEVSITFSEFSFTSENNSIVEVNIPLVNERNDAAKSINSAIKNHVITALQIEEPNNFVEEGIESFNASYIDFINSFPESAQEWEAQIDGEVIFQSKDITSVSLTSYINTGGAHGNVNISFLNFETSTGKLIENHKLFTNVDTFKTIAKTYFETNVKDKDILFDEENFQLPKNIGYSDDGIILLYNAYEVAAYATGIIEFSIPFDEAKPYLIFNSF